MPTGGFNPAKGGKGKVIESSAKTKLTYINRPLGNRDMPAWQVWMRERGSCLVSRGKKKHEKKKPLL